MRFIASISVVLLLLAVSGSMAAEKIDKKSAQVLSQLARAVKSGDTELCPKYLSSASQSYCDRFIGYGLLPCLPTQVKAESSKPSGRYTILRTRVDGLSDGAKYAKLAFTGGKLDIPETLRIGLGAAWEKRVNLLEQVYLVMRAQMGDSISCDNLEALATNKL